LIPKASRESFDSFKEPEILMEIRGTSLRFPEDVSIALDVDGVVADFKGHFCETARELGVDFFDHHSLWTNFFPVYEEAFDEVWGHVKGRRSWWLGIPPLDQWVDFPVDRYVTSRPVPSELTKTWLSRQPHLPEAPVHTVGVGGSKKEVLSEAGTDVFIDDRPKNVRDAYKAQALGILKETPTSRRSMHQEIGVSESGLPFTGDEVSLHDLTELRWLLSERVPGWLAHEMLSHDESKVEV
jgi:hypothetical protein